MASDAYERILCVKNEVFVYRIPPRPSNRGYRAADWKLDSPDWTGRLRVTALNKQLFIKMEDKNSGELFAQCPVEAYPGIAVEQVLDSSRYFVIRIRDESGRNAFIGIGFADRGDAFDLNVALQDHFKYMQKEKEFEELSKTPLDSGPKLDLGFKEGQTITINIGTKKTDRPRPKGNTTGLLPPPPGGIKLAAPPKPQMPVISPQQQMAAAPAAPVPQPVSNQTASTSSNVDLLCDFGMPPSQPVALPQNTADDPWGNFTSGNVSSQSSNSDADSWVNF